MKNICMILPFMFLFALKSFAGTEGCEKPIHPVKKLICKDSSFEELYRKLDIAFEKEVSLTTAKVEAEAEQDAWLGSTTSECRAKSECYTDRFTARLSLLVERNKKSEKDNAKDDKNRVQVVSGFPDKKLLSSAEVFLVSGYASNDGLARASSSQQTLDNSVSPQRIYLERKNKILIDRPGSKVLLVLSSFKGTQWGVEATSGTTIIGILASGSEVVFSSVKTNLYTLAMPYAYEAGSANFKAILSVLNNNLGIDSVDVFRGSYIIPDDIVINSLDKPSEKLSLVGIKPKKIDSNFSFELSAPDSSVSQWSLSGPIAADTAPAVILKNRVRIDKKIYQIRNDKLEIIDENNKRLVPPDLPTSFPVFSNLEDLAYDPDKKIISVVSLGGEGFWYRYSVQNQNWIDFSSMKNIDVSSIFFDKRKNLYYGIGAHSKLVTVSPEGKIIADVYILDQLPGFQENSSNRLYLKVLAAVDDVALVGIENDTVKRIWHYNLSSKKASLTYKFDLEFSCAKILTRIEKFICTDKKIAEMEQIVKELYEKRLSEYAPSGRKVIEQNVWKSDIRDKCSDKGCLNDVYEARIEYLNTEIKLLEADFLDNLLNLSEELPDKSIAIDAEVVVVSGYKAEAFRFGGTDNRRKREEGTSVSLKLDRPGSKVILVLTSYENISWSINVSKNTNLVGLIVSNAVGHSVVLSNKKPNLYAGKVSRLLSYTDRSDSAEFKKLLVRLNDMISVKKIDVFKGYDVIPNEITINALDKPNDSLSLVGKAPTKASKNLNFELFTLKRKKVKWSLNNPETVNPNGEYSQEEFAIIPGGYNYYALKNNGIEIHNPFIETAQLSALPSHFPALSNLSGIAYDSKRGALAVISNSGEGYFYRYDVKQEKWIDYHGVNSFDAATLAYDEINDRYIAWGELFGEGKVLLFISHDGKILFKESVENSIPEFKATYPSSTIKIIPKGDDVILVALSNRKVTHIWSYNLTTKSGELTYKLAWNEQ